LKKIAALFEGKTQFRNGLGRGFGLTDCEEKNRLAREAPAGRGTWEVCS
jgi:hypothetical protein